MKTSMTKLISEFTKAEGKKVSISFGNAKELMAIVKKKCKEDPRSLAILLEYLVSK